MNSEHDLSFAGSKILIVDDVAANRKVLTQTLESAGYTVSAAPNGPAALGVLERLRPDLVLLDLLMPGMSGFEVCHRMKSNENTSRIPVIIITAHNEPDSVVQGFRVGAVDYICKPFQIEEVLARVETHLKLSGLTRALLRSNEELLRLNAQLSAEMAARQQAEQSFSIAVEGRQEPFHTSGTLGHDAPSYVERKADRELLEGLRKGDLCYVFTSRQMGKSSLMVRMANRLRQQHCHVATVDLAAIGCNLTLPQWYNGLLSRIGQCLHLENELDDFWFQNERYGPAQRFFAALREIVFKRRAGRLVFFIDELDMVRSLPFSTDEFFAAIRECYNGRSEDAKMNRLNFCLLGVAPPAELVQNPNLTFFNSGRRIPLEDFTPEEAVPLARSFQAAGPSLCDPESLLERILYWTSGHPYLTQRLCRAVVDDDCRGRAKRMEPAGAIIDRICDTLFFSARAHERDTNLIFVRERLLRCPADPAQLLRTYSLVLAGRPVPDNEDDPSVNHLHLAGIVRSQEGRLRVRNRIYERVFNQAWIESKLARLSEGS